MGSLLISHKDILTGKECTEANIKSQAGSIIFSPSGIKCKYEYNLTKTCLNRALPQTLVLKSLFKNFKFFLKLIKKKGYINTLCFGANIIAYFVRQTGIQNIRILDNFSFLDPWLERSL